MCKKNWHFFVLNLWTLCSWELFACWSHLGSFLQPVHVPSSASRAPFSPPVVVSVGMTTGGTPQCRIYWSFSHTYSNIIHDTVQYANIDTHFYCNYIRNTHIAFSGVNSLSVSGGVIASSSLAFMVEELRKYPPTAPNRSLQRSAAVETYSS